MLDQKKIQAAILSLIEAIGENPKREGVTDTPRRINCRLGK